MTLTFSTLVGYEDDISGDHNNEIRKNSYNIIDNIYSYTNSKCNNSYRNNNDKDRNNNVCIVPNT